MTRLHLRSKRSLLRTFQLSVSLLSMLIMLNNSLLVVYADSDLVGPSDSLSLEDLRSINRDYPWFNTELSDCQASSDVSGAVATGPAADLLTKAGLDPKWVSVIVQDAGEANADPIAMASLLFWENRQFPSYKTDGWGGSPSVGEGPWQITLGTWPSSAGSYSGAQDPAIATKVAAKIVTSYGGIAGYPLGSIQQSFGQAGGKAVNLKTVATLAKNYNAGMGSYRDPSVSDWRTAGRTWYGGGGPGGAWDSGKANIIDDYVVGMTYIYYQIATGTKISYTNDNAYIKEALTHESTLKNFIWKPSAAAGGSTPSTGSSSGAPTIVIDPGNAQKSDINVDPSSNIAVFDSSNAPSKEMSDNWAVANAVKTQLESAGYKVILTKSNVDGTDASGKPNTNLKQRADVGTQNKADLGITIHTVAGSSSGAQSQNTIIVPQVNNWRQTADGKKLVNYTDEGLANADASLAQTFQQTRAAALNISPNDVRIGSLEAIKSGAQDNSIPGVISKGTVPTTSFFATIPWLYMEEAQDSGGQITGTTADKYAKGIVDGVKKSIPVTNSATSGCTGASASNGVVQGDIVKTALYYAWPSKGHGPGAPSVSDKGPIDATPQYQRDMPKFDPSAKDAFPYSDCGVFVRTVLAATGIDPNYPARGTATQELYVEAHPEKYQRVTPTDPNRKTLNTSDLKPGDIFIVYYTVGNALLGHTFIYTGKEAYGSNNKDGFDSAAASLNGHVPEADYVYFSQAGHNFNVWRVKG